MAGDDEKDIRITFKRKRPNPLFEEWLELLHEDAKVKNSKIEPMLREALTSLSKYPLPLKSGAECAILKGFNAKLCKYLYNFLLRYKNFEKSNKNSSNGSSENEELTSPIKNSVGSQTTSNPNILSKVSQNNDVLVNGNGMHSDNSQNVAGPSRIEPIPKSLTNVRSRERIYKPAYRSGAYAILLALLERMQEYPEDPCLIKEHIVHRAQRHSEESFVRPKPDTFYTAWSNISRLVSKGLVVKIRKKKVFYSLTEAGKLLATDLLNESKIRPTVNDIIFNNPVPSSSTENGHTHRTVEVDAESVSSQCSDVSLTVIEMPAGSFDIILLIDKNETGGVTKKNDPTVAQFNKYPDLKHEYRSLKVGDFTWIARHKVNKEHELVLPYVVERKRMDDLGSSIKDGRFHEQKFRLRKCGLKNVIYMIENYGSNKNIGLPLQSLMQALANTRVQDDFKIHMTDSLSNSARFLAMLTLRLTVEFQNKDLKGYNKEPKDDYLMIFDYFNKSSAKTKPLTVTETFIKLLLQLKGVSVEKALTITDVYGTPASLIKAYKNCSPKEGEMLLANLKYGDTTRNVGPKISKTIFQLFTFKNLS